MKHILPLFALFLLLAFQSEPNIKTVVVLDNPIFNKFNEPIDFASINAQHITHATDSIQILTNASIAKIIAVKSNERTFDNTILEIDNLSAELGKVHSVIYLMGSTHTDSIIRITALNSSNLLSQYGNEISLNEDLYNAVKVYSQSNDAKNLKGYQAKFLKETVEEYERNGFALSKEKRAILKTLNDYISETGNKFNENINSYKDFLIVTEAEIDGLPEDYKEARKQEDGTYKIDLSYPSYRPFVKYSNSEKARKKLVIKYNNRAYPDNIEVLQNLLKKRKEMAELLGHRSYAAYKLQDRMAKTPETVWEFENKLNQELKAKSQLDYDELLEIKKTKIEDAKVINGWENSYYSNILNIEKYKLDAELVKEYFALDDVLAGLFSITQSLFEVTYKEVKNASVWNDAVRMFEVFQEGKLKGRFYLDLFPRENKFGHAACFGIIKGKMTSNGYTLPTASLVCNFPKPTAAKPSLMPHAQVNTLFHEFGHVLHQMLTTADLASQSGTSVSRDFVEAPSQIFENWTWNYDALKLFAKHYKTREVMPQELFNKMLAAKNVGSGMLATRQVFLGSYDMTLHDLYDPNGSETTTDILKKLQGEIRLISYIEGTHFQTAFGHLNGYGASYYGYLWSKVYAQDMFSVFDKNGILDQKTGIRYRDIILAPGSSRDELGLVKEFLGRDPNNKAFLKELGL